MEIYISTIILQVVCIGVFCVKTNKHVIICIKSNFVHKMAQPIIPTLPTPLNIWISQGSERGVVGDLETHGEKKL